MLHLHDKTTTRSRQTVMPKYLIPAAVMLLAACPGAPVADDAEDRADRVREAARAETGSDATVVPEAWLSEMTADVNIDSHAAWAATDGRVLVIPTAKANASRVDHTGNHAGTARHGST